MESVCVCVTDWAREGTTHTPPGVYSNGLTLSHFSLTDSLYRLQKGRPWQTHGEYVTHTHKQPTDTPNFFYFFKIPAENLNFRKFDFLEGNLKIQKFHFKTNIFKLPRVFTHTHNDFFGGIKI
jgi:hypothetical protein